MKETLGALAILIPCLSLFGLDCQNAVEESARLAREAGFEPLVPVDKDYSKCREIGVYEGACAIHRIVCEHNKTLTRFDQYSRYGLADLIVELESGKFVEKNLQLSEKIISKAIAEWNGGDLNSFAQVFGMPENYKKKLMEAALEKSDEAGRKMIKAQNSFQPYASEVPPIEERRKMFDDLASQENPQYSILSNLGTDLMREYAAKKDFENVDAVLGILEKYCDDNWCYLANTVLYCYAPEDIEKRDLKHVFGFLDRNFQKLPVPSREILAYMYENGICTPKNEKRAAEIRTDYDALYEDPSASEFWADLYSLYSGNGQCHFVVPDLERALGYAERGLAAKVVNRNYIIAGQRDRSGKSRYMQILGEAYLYGKGRPKDIDKAIEYLTKANSMMEGSCWYGYGPNTQIYDALMEEGMYERAFACIASEEDREPMHGLRAEYAALAFAGHCVNGVGVEKNPERAFRLIRKRVKLSENPALLETYAYFLENGIGCKADPKEAAAVRNYILRLSAVNAIHNLGAVYFPNKNHKYPSPTSGADMDEVYGRLYKFAESVGGGAKSSLAWILWEGAPMEKCADKIFTLLSEIAEGKDCDSGILCRLAMMRLFGVGCKADPKEAESLLLRARGLENSGYACELLSYAHSKGLGGMEKNGELSQKYLDEFISSGYANGSVAAVYLYGKVVPKDAARAKFVLECAIKNGSANASRLLRHFENELK